MTPANRPKWSPKKRVAVAAGTVAVGAGLVAGGLALKAHNRPGRVAVRAETPAMVQAARTRDFHTYDRLAVQSYPLSSKTRKAILENYGALTNIAGNTYNIPTVAETLSVVNPTDVDTAVRISGWAKTPRMDRRADIIQRALATPGGTKAIEDLFRISGSTRELGDLRGTFYGRDKKTNWEHGTLVSGTHTNYPFREYEFQRKDARFKQLDIESQRTKAKARNR